MSWTKDEAVEREFAGILQRIASGFVAPRAGLAELVDLHLRQPDPEGVRYVGEEYGVAQLIGYFYGYDDLEERPAEVSFAGLHGRQAMAALDAEVVRLALAWLAERGA